MVARPHKEFITILVTMVFAMGILWGGGLRVFTFRDHEPSAMSTAAAVGEAQAMVSMAQ